MVVGAIGVAACLMVINQVGTVDGLFLFCSSTVVAFAFGLYLRWMLLIGRAHRAAGFVIRTPQNVWSEDNSKCRGDLCFVKRAMIC